MLPWSTLIKVLFSKRRRKCFSFSKKGKLGAFDYKGGVTQCVYIISKNVFAYKFKMAAHLKLIFLVIVFSHLSR